MAVQLPPQQRVGPLPTGRARPQAACPYCPLPTSHCPLPTALCNWRKRIHGPVVRRRGDYHGEGDRIRGWGVSAIRVRSRAIAGGAGCGRSPDRATALDSLYSGWVMGVHQIVIVGRPNVGKSSLFNWLAGQRIAIVDPTAGVTRDRVTHLVEIYDRFLARDVHRVGRHRRDGRPGPRQPDRAHRGADRDGHRLGRRDPLRRRYPLGRHAAGPGGRRGGSATSVSRSSAWPTRPTPRSWNRRPTSSTASAASDRRQREAEPGQAGAARRDLRAPAGRRRGDELLAGRAGDEGGHRGPPQHGQEHVRQHAGPGRADDRQRGARHHPRQRRRPLRARRQGLRGHRHARLPPREERRHERRLLQHATGPSGASAGPTWCCCSSTPASGSARSTSNSATTSPSSTSRASSWSTSGTSWPTRCPRKAGSPTCATPSAPCGTCRSPSSPGRRART